MKHLGILLYIIIIRILNSNMQNLVRVMGHDDILDKFGIKYNPNGLLWAVSTYQAGFDNNLIQNLFCGKP